MTGYVMTAVVLLAEDAPRNTGPDFGKASPIALLILVLLLISVLVLGRSMTKQLRKVPENFDDVPETDPQYRKQVKKLQKAGIEEDLTQAVEGGVERATESTAEIIEAAETGSGEPGDAPGGPKADG